MQNSLRAGLLIALLIALAPTAYAGVWLGVSFPLRYEFKDQGNRLFALDPDSSGSVRGSSIIISLPSLPILGYENYQVSIREKNALEDKALMEINLYDIYVGTSGKSYEFLVGYGIGNVKASCLQAACETLTFTPGAASQVMAQIGVPISDLVIFHISAHVLKAKLKVESATDSADLDLGGKVYAFGIKVGW